MGITSAFTSYNPLQWGTWQ